MKIIMKISMFVAVSIIIVSYISGCQAIYKPNYEYVDSPARNSHTDNPYWVNDYRVNSSNYFGNPAAINLTFHRQSAQLFC